MHYLIDGYNLLFHLKLPRDSLQGNRQKLIENINKKVSALNLSCTIIFDATLADDSSRSHLDSLEIIFTSQGQTADEWIIEELKHKKGSQKYLVVTGDKQLAWLARQQQVQTQSIDEFLTTLSRRYKNINKPKHPKKQLSDIFHSLNKQELHSSLPQPELPKPASPAKIPEGSVDYYLQLFEKRAEELPLESTTSSTSVKYKKPKPAPEKKDEASEMARWLRLFEKKNSSD